MQREVIIRGGMIVDGAGNPWYRGDVAVAGGKISEIKRSLKPVDGRVIDAEGLVVAPGFIDAHSHSDSVTLYYREMESNVMQGVTTVVAGQCGSSPAPVNPDMRDLLQRRLETHLPPEVDLKITWTTFDDYLKEEEKDGLGANVAHLVGHGAIRTAAMGFEARAPTLKEVEIMKDLTAEAMEAGAFGLSTGLIYPPGIFAETDEIVELTKVSASYGGVYDTHIRGEGRTLMKALEEAISVGRTAGLPVQISHHKAASKVVWGKSVDTLAMIERARSEGVDVSVDQYPYRAGATSLATLIPPWAHEGGIEKLLERLHDGELRQKMREDIEKGIPGWENFAGELGWESIYISRVKSDENKPLEGMNLTEITKLRGDADPITSLFEVLTEEEGAAGMILFSMNEDDIKRIMRHPVHMVGTDSGSMSPTGYMSRGKPHPRGYGSYPKILGRYVREMSVLKLEDAVRKMTSMPAQRFGLLDRGLLRPGMCADIVVFNPDTVVDRATYQDPHQFPEGIEYVLVNGKVAVDGGKYSPVLAGRTLRKK